MNIELLEDVKAEIKANPGCFNYSSWEHCIAGITCRLSGLETRGLSGFVFVPHVGHRTCSAAAQELLGLSGAEAAALFVWWPIRFRLVITAAVVVRLEFSFFSSAKAAVARINAFIREKGYTPRECQRLPKRDPFGVPTFALL